jgi:hypothetical protein
MTSRMYFVAHFLAVHGGRSALAILLVEMLVAFAHAGVPSVQHVAWGRSVP